MATKVIPLNKGVRIISGKLVPYLEINWADYSLTQLTTLLDEVLRIEIEHNPTRHKHYKDQKGANVEIHQGINQLTISSLGNELLYIKDSLSILDEN